MKKAFILLFICITVFNMTVFSVGADIEGGPINFSLEEAVEYALENSPLISISDTKIKGEEVNLNEQTQEYSRNIGAKLSFYDPNPLNTLKLKKGYFKSAAEMSLLLAEKQKEQIIETVKFLVESSYFNVINAKERVSIQEGILEHAEKNYQNAQKKKELGMASDLEVMSFETSCLQARLDKDRLQREYEYELMLFNKNLGLPLNTVVNLTDSIDVKPLAEVDIDQKIKEAHGNRLEVITAEEAFKLNEFNFAIVSSYYTPNTFRYQQAKFEMETSKHQLDDTKQNIELSVRRVYIDMINSFETIGVVQKSVEQAEKAYEVVNMRYEVGMATNNDVIEALNSLREARLLQAQSILIYNLAVKNLRHHSV